MKKILKRTLHVFSLASLMALVFSGSIVGKLAENKNSNQKDRPTTPEGLFSAFASSKALADAPAPPPPSDGDSPGCGGDGCSSGCDGSCGGGDC